MANVPCINYMKAVDFTDTLGSSSTICSTSSVSSFACTESGNEAYFEDESPIAGVPMENVSGIHFGRTPLSAKARPFISTPGAGYNAAGLGSLAWDHECTEAELSMAHERLFEAMKPIQNPVSPPIQNPVGPCFTTVVPSPEPSSPAYNEQKQEELYLPSNVGAKPMYNESLQEDLYLTKDESTEERKLCPGDKKVYTHKEYMEWAVEHFQSVEKAQKYWDRKMKPAPSSPRGRVVEEEVIVEDEVKIPSKDEQLNENSPSEDNTPTTKKSKKKDKQQAAASPQNRSNFSAPLPVKHTFIHFAENDNLQNEPSNSPMRRSRSAPGKLIQNEFSDLSFGMRMAKTHLMGACMPCAYYHNKKDGCRQGPDCKFCHICPVDEIRKRKKAKVKMLREKHQKMAAAKEEPELSPAGDASAENSSGPE